jgi:hypothetical protein
MGIGVDIGVRLAGMGSHPSGAPPAETIVRTPLGTVAGEGGTIIKAGVNVAAGSYLFIAVAADGYDNPILLPQNVTLSGVTADTQIVGSPVRYASTSEMMLAYIYCAAAVTNATVQVVLVDNGMSEIYAHCMTLTQVAGLAASAALDKTAYAVGESASPSSGATAVPSQAHEFVVGVVATFGPPADAPGTWTAPLEAGQRCGQPLTGADTIGTISEGFCIQTAAAARTAAKTGITGRPWGAIVATFKAAA